MRERGIAAVRKHLAKQPTPDSMTFEQQREQYDRAEKAFSIPPDMRVESVSAPVASAEWLRPSPARDDTAVLYLHGGGYVIGSPRSHRHLAAAIAIAAGAPALLLDYRRAPECPFPAALEDAVAAYRWLLDTGFAARRLVIAGDSAGGGLTIATLLALRDAGVPLAAAGICISPWVDLTCSSGGYEAKAASDPIISVTAVGAMARSYLGDADAKGPLASPLYADLRGLPPLLIHVGSEEVLLDDAVSLAERAKAAGVDATLEVWDQMVHVWHWFLPMLDEAAAAIDRIGRFIRARVS
jgi:monoterpene epsilon-lactone hydrolase